LSLPDCLKEYVGNWIVSPRDEVFGTGPQKYLLSRMNDKDQYVEIRFESGTALRLHYWRFKKVVDILSEANGKYVMVGSRINPDDETTIEGLLVKEALMRGYRYAKLRTAAFVCDLIVLCGYAQYGYTQNPETSRRCFVDYP